MDSLLTSNAVDRGFEPDQVKPKTIKLFFVTAKYAALRRKSKDWLARNQDNVSEWGDMSIRDCCFSELAL